MNNFHFTNCSDVEEVASFALAPHSHSLGQLTFIRWGLMHVETDDASWVIPEGRLCWTPPGVAHAARCPGNASYWQLLVSPAYTAMLPGEVCALRVSALALAAFDRAVALPSEDLPSEDPPGEGLPMREGTAEGAVLHQVVRHELARAVREPFGIALPRTDPWRGIARLLRDDPADRRSLDEFAALAGLSRRTFSRHFRRETGTSFARWRQAALGQKGLDLLSAGTSVSDTAMALGYESVSAFIYAFRKRFGMAPLQFLGRRRSDARDLMRTPPAAAMR